LSHSPDDPDRVRRLDRRGLVLGVAALAFAVMLGGLLASPHPYGSVDFVVDFFAAELVLAAVLLGAVLAAFPAARLGLGAPRGIEPRRVVPLALLLAAAVGMWLFARASLPDGAAADADTSWRVLRTTALVGFNEELLFRGLLLVAFWRWWGARRGAVAAMVAFGAFHLLNMAGGVPPLGAAFQFLFTMLAGAIFIQGAVGARSLWPAMVVHALYDAATFDLGRFAVAGAGHGPALALGGIALVLGVWSLVQFRSLAGAEPYAR
jgi:uncharacterized protein